MGLIILFSTIYDSTVLFQSPFKFIYSIFNKKFTVLASAKTYKYQLAWWSEAFFDFLKTELQIAPHELHVQLLHLHRSRRCHLAIDLSWFVYGHVMRAIS